MMRLATAEAGAFCPRFLGARSKGPKPRGSLERCAALPGKVYVGLPYGAQQVFAQLAHGGIALGLVLGGGAQDDAVERRP